MIFEFKRTSSQALLSPFVLKINAGYLLGIGAEPGSGSPCVHCCELWLTRRRIASERISVDELPIRKDLIAEVIRGNNPHVLYEISKDGSASRLDCWIFAHPMCGCNSENFFVPAHKTKKLNFAFSPISQLKCARFSTPSGNVWLSSVTGTSPVSEKAMLYYAAARDREVSRLLAVDEWLKRAAFSELSLSVAQGKPYMVEDFKSGKPDMVSANNLMGLSGEGLGAGASRQSAVLNALSAFAKARTLKKYAATMKSPMLMVGANNWVRNRVPFYLLQQYDLHLLFYPNSTPTWVVGVAGISRVNTIEPPVFVFGSGPDIVEAIDSALLKMLDRCRPEDWQGDGATTGVQKSRPKSKISRQPKLGLWWTHWIYRCPKVSLKDILLLEPYKPTLKAWRDYFRDGQESLSIMELNTPFLPVGLRTLVKVNGPKGAYQERIHNVNGIGTWSSFSEAVL